MEAKPSCPKCHTSTVYRNGKVLGKQRDRCKECGFQFTRTTARGRPAHKKALAVTLYTMGLSLSAIARLFHVSPLLLVDLTMALFSRFHVSCKLEGIKTSFS